jgi:glutamine synthetase
MEQIYHHRRGGENVFMHDTDDRKIPGQVGLWAIGGVMEHLPALTALGSSTVNSYRRLWDAGFWAPVYADWGYQNRTCGLRVSAPGRFEYRSVDSAHNPYLMGSGLLAAFGHGIEEKMDPGKPEQANMYEANAGKEKLPMTLGEALDKLDKDELIQGALPGDMLRVFTEYKRDEWEEFLATPTQWDLDKYLDCLP